MEKNALGSAAENKFSDPRVTICPHDKQIDFVFGDIVFEDMPDRLPVRLDVFRNRFDAMSCEVLRQPCT